MRRVESFPFNPNTVSVSDLQRLGFTLKQAQSIDAYRQKGGRFRRKSDFAKSYVVSDSLFRRLEPYIDIPLLDLNLADSVAFDALPGIGGYFARQMVLHRKRLGGSYSNVCQLLEIYHFTQEKLDKIADLIQIDSASMRPYPLWELPVDSLRKHPAIGNYATARSLVLYREHNPPSQWTLQGLLQAGVITSSQYERLSLCYLKSPFPQ
jgi:DNA uptake protein ComE-like DNA-binding protein